MISRSIINVKTSIKEKYYDWKTNKNENKKHRVYKTVFKTDPHPNKVVIKGRF